MIATEINKDYYYMQKALELAERARGATSPNPMVGCVIVKNGKIIGEGYHKKAGEAHAEIVALNSAKEDTKHSTFYITLEPCNHYGKTPPCAPSIVEARPHRVVIAMKDPNPLVAGKGIELLKSSGIEVEVGILEESARKLNEIYIKYITDKVPFVIAKWAMTMDGKIATVTGDSKYISCAESLKKTHEIRNSVDAILVGGHTVLRDNPSLTVRFCDVKHKSPIRIILDTKEGLRDNLFVLTDKKAPTWIITPYNREYVNADKTIKITNEEDKLVSLTGLIKELGKYEITSLLIEGGGKTLSSAFSEGIIDKIYCFICPHIFGGAEAITPVMGQGIAKNVDESIKLKIEKTTHIGTDICIEAYVIKQKGVS